MQNVLSHELCAVPLALFYSNGSMRHTTKSNLLNKIAIKRILIFEQLMKSLQSFFQAIMNMKCWLYFLINVILNFQ